MKRRTFLAGFASMAAASGTIFGSGAFTSINAERAITADVADDDRAFLRLEPLVDEGIEERPTRRSFTNGRTVGFEIPGNGDGENQNAEGAGLDSVYEFHNLLRIENQGTQAVEVYSEYDGSALADLALVRDSGVLRNHPPTLDVGEQFDVGLYIDTHGSNTGEYDETLTIVADQPDN